MQYVLRIGAGGITPPDPATAVLWSGSQPIDATVGIPTSVFSVTTDGWRDSSFVVTPSSSVSGTFSPSSVTMPVGNPAVRTFSFTASAAGSASISLANDGGLSNPSPTILTIITNPAADRVTLTGPTSGTVGAASTAFSVGVNGSLTGAVIVTPATTGGGTFTPTTVTIPAGTTPAAQTFTYTPASSGAKSITLTNNGGLSNPSAWTYTASAGSGAGTQVPNPASTIVALSLTAPSTGDQPWAVGHVFKQGDLPSATNLSGIQKTVISTWPDGSARLALLASVINFPTTTSSVNIGAGTPPSGTSLSTGDLKTQLSQAVTVSAGAFGSATWTGTDWDSPFETWASGPIFSSWIYRKQIGADSHLVAWLEVRLWATGAVEILPWIENGYLLVTGPTNKSATYTFTMGGTQRFSAAIDLPHHCRTPLVSGTALSHWLSTDRTVVAKHDAAYMQQTEMVPSYYATVSPGAAIVTGQPSTYTPLQQGSFSPTMGAGGYQAAIGPLPEWDVLYLTSTAASLWGVVQRQGYSAGRYGVHYRDASTQRPAIVNDHPTLGVYDSAITGITDIGTSATVTPAPAGTTPQSWDTQHSPSMGYMAALLTGRFYHVETTQFVASIHWLKEGSFSPRREGARGLIKSQSGSFSHRGAAWALRSLAQAVAIAPTGSAMLTEWRRVLDENIDYYHDLYAAGHNSFGFVETYQDITAPRSGTTQAGSTSTVVKIASIPGIASGSSAYDGEYVNYKLTIGGETRTISAYDGVSGDATVSSAFGVSTASVSAVVADQAYQARTWQLDFFNAAWGYTKALQVTTAKTAKLDAFYLWNAKSVVGRFGLVASGDYLYRDAAMYNIYLSPSDTTDWAGKTGPWFNNWGEVWATGQLFNNTGSKVLGDGSLRNPVPSQVPTDITGYWGNVQPALAYAVRHNVPGADAAMGRMTMAPTWATMLTNFNANPVWSVRPWYRAVPSWVPASNTVTTLTNANGKLSNHYRDVTTTVPGYSYVYAVEALIAYGGAAKNKHWGNWGGIMWRGTGHASSNNGQMVVGEFTATGMTYKLVADPTNYYPANTGFNERPAFGSGYQLYARPDIVDPNWGDSFPLDGKYTPTSLHTYGIPFVIGPEYGGAAYGTYFEVGLIAGSYDGFVNMLAGHKLAFTTTAPDPATIAWQRASAAGTPVNYTLWGSPWAVAYVPTQNRAYIAAAGSSAYEPRWLDMTSGDYVQGTGTGFSSNFAAEQFHIVYVPAREMVVHAYRNTSSGNLVIEHYDVTQAQPTKIGPATLSASLALPAKWSALAWCKDNNRLLIGGVETGAIHEIEIPMDAVSGTWTVTRRAFASGSIVWADVSYSNSFNKWAYDEGIRAIAYQGVAALSGDDTVYVYRPQGT